MKLGWNQNRRKVVVKKKVQNETAIGRKVREKQENLYKWAPVTSYADVFRKKLNNFALGVPLKCGERFGERKLNKSFLGIKEEHFTSPKIGDSDMPHKKAHLISMTVEKNEVKCFF